MEERFASSQLCAVRELADDSRIMGVEISTGVYAVMIKNSRQTSTIAETDAVRNLVRLNLVTNMGLWVSSSTSESLKFFIFLTFFCIYLSVAHFIL